LLSRAAPAYPEAARRARVTGTVDVVLSIDKQGTVVRATAVEGSPLLRPSAEDAARKWRYRPEFVNGAPVETERRVRIVFQ
jgi:protein TonB